MFKLALCGVLLGAPGISAAKAAHHPPTHLTAVNGSRPLSTIERLRLAESVGAVLKDPASAQYKLGPFKVGASRYCGLVNAKNSFGGYNGFRNFSVTVLELSQGQLSFVNPDVSNDDQETLRPTC